MVNEKSQLNELRYNGFIKGNRPFICVMQKTTTAFFKRTRRYVVSYRDNTIYFQSLNFFNDIPNFKYDYAINIKAIKSYIYQVIKDRAIIFTIKLQKKGYIVLQVALNYKRRIYSQLEFADFVKYLNKKGILDEDQENRSTDC